MTATEEGIIQPGFPTPKVADNSADSWVTLYAEASANVLITSINAKAVARCAPQEGAQLPAVKVLKAAEKAVDDIQVQPAADVESGSDATLSAKVTKKGAPVAGQEVTFKLDGRTATGVSNDDGIATAAIRTLRSGERTYTATIGELSAQGTVQVNAKGNGETEKLLTLLNSATLCARLPRSPRMMRQLRTKKLCLTSTARRSKRSPMKMVKQPLNSPRPWLAPEPSPRSLTASRQLRQ
ncbi:hypothetical protein [Corynebacterium ulceribovis]|uniref:hypothetical protein n=1 Tax=Corynebacterium ulceribovis TaxID=487732 RepID=UPI00037C1F88|nr:hypothetical protein [Corynebacterium ulceribovis]